MNTLQQFDKAKTLASEQLIKLQRDDQATTEELNKSIDEFEKACTRYRAQLQLEAANETEVIAKDHPKRAAKLAGYLKPELEGPEAELNQELQLRENYIPLEIFFGEDDDEATEVHTRADAATSVYSDEFSKKTYSTFGRLWPRMLASFFGLSTSVVSAGTAQYSVLNSAGTASTLLGGTAKSSTAATFSFTELKPLEMVSRHLYRSNDLLVNPQLEQILLRDCREQLLNGVDSVIFEGNTSPSVTGLFDVPSSRENTTTTPALFINKLEALLGSGVYSADLSELRLALGIQTSNAFRSSQYFTGTNETLFSFLKSQGLEMRISEKIPAKASGAQIGLAQRKRLQSAKLISWQGVQVLREPDTAKREMALTCVLRFNFSKVRAEEFSVVDFKF